MAAPLGNTNAQKGRRWRHAIEWALAHADEPSAIEKIVSQERALYQIAARVVEAALKRDTLSAEDNEQLVRLLGVSSGEWKFAIEEIGNRLDGKPAQSIALSGDGEGSPIPTAITIAFVQGDEPR